MSDITAIRETRAVPAKAPAKSKPVAKAPVQKDSVSLSAKAREGMQRLKAASKDMVQADLAGGLHVQFKGFGQALKLSVDRNGLHNEAKVAGLAGEFHTDSRGVEIRAEHGHSEAGIGLTTTDGAKAMLDTLGIRLEGVAGPEGVTGAAKKSDNGVVIPISPTGGELRLQQDGNLDVDGYGVKAGVNVKDGSGAHAGYHRFGAGVDLSLDQGLGAHIGSKQRLK